MKSVVQSQATPQFVDGTLPQVERGFSFHFASEYCDRGWSVIPLAGKRPAVSSWSEFRERRADLSELRQWFKSGSGNLGIITGALSGLVVVDCDSTEDADFWSESFPRTPLASITGRGGSHFYYRYPSDEVVGNRAGLLKRQIDLRGEGGYVVAPPSLHPNGTQYRWQSSEYYCLDEIPYFSPTWIARVDVPVPVTRSCEIRTPRSYIRSIHAVSGQGGHNQTFRAACKLRDAGLSPEDALSELLIWNRSNASPPWSTKELHHKIQSAYEQRSGSKMLGRGRHD
jgi:hypothetical protein